MMMKLTAMMSAMALSACATLPISLPTSSAKSDDPAVPEEIVVASLDGSQTLTALEESNLPKGKCGMVLWTLDSQRPAAVFRFIVGEEAEIRLDHIPVALTRADFNGASGFGLYEGQSFSSATGINVEVTARFGLGFDNGQYLERGLIRVTGPQGWEVVTPAAGIAGCRAK